KNQIPVVQRVASFTPFSFKEDLKWRPLKRVSKKSSKAMSLSLLEKTGLDFGMRIRLMVLLTITVVI
uniref:hypothetical protein n=1 Tax=uncultured Parasutterella sp. TaxID=1263098 RepID=UPI0025939FB3